MPGDADFISGFDVKICRCRVLVPHARADGVPFLIGVGHLTPHHASKAVDFDRQARVVAEANATVAAAAHLRHVLRNATIVFLVACLFIPSATWAVAWWQTRTARAEAAEQEKRIAAMMPIGARGGVAAARSQGENTFH